MRPTRATLAVPASADSGEYMTAVKPCVRGHSGTERSTKSVANPKCLACEREAQRVRYAKRKAEGARQTRKSRTRDIEALRARDRARYHANKEKHAAKNRAYRAKNATKLAAYDRRRYGLPEPTRARPASCECCGRKQKGRALALDHCHATGIFRGWLCDMCNTAIGKLGDDLRGVSKALAYLQAAYST